MDTRQRRVVLQENRFQNFTGSSANYSMSLSLSLTQMNAQNIFSLGISSQLGRVTIMKTLGHRL